jgi:tetratricopeptide (TPR) repeat protein/spermidine synthase
MSFKPYFIVFMASACGLIIEIVAGRLLAPDIGVSLYTWTAIIGVVLAGISAGSFLGGLVADRFPEPTTLGLILLAGGVSSLSILPLTSVAPGLFRDLPAMAQIVMLTGALFFLPSLILGMVAPVTIKLRLNDLARTGNVVGRIYAVSAAGSIFGTFATGFLLIQWIGTRSTIILVAAALVVMALTFGNLWRVKLPSLVSLALFIGLGSLGFTNGAFESTCLRESNYYCIRVSDTLAEGGREVKALHLDTLLHSYVDLEDPTFLEYGYEQIFGEIAAYLAQQDPAPRVLFIGGGGYTMPRYLEELYPRSTLEVIEIDPEVTRVAFEHLGLRPDTRIVTYNQDARAAMARFPEGSYGLVIGDAFNDVAIPYHLTTREFNEEVKALLEDDGVYAVNLIDHLHRGGFARSYVHTLRQTFPYVYLVRDDANWEDDGQSTYVAVGSLQAISPSALEEANMRSGSTQPVSHFMPGASLDSWLTAGKKILLTDDHAPVENLLVPAYLARNVSKRAGRHYDSGMTLLGQEKLREAIAEFDRAIGIDPELAEGYFGRGQSYEELDMLLPAIRDYNQVIRLSPGIAEVYFSRGHAWETLAQFRLAIPDYDRAIHLDPEYGLAYHNRGTTYGSLGQLSLAIQDFDQAIRLDPEYPLAYYNRGLTYLKLGQLTGAVQDLDEAIRLDPQYARAYNNRGTARMKLGRFPEAIQDLSEAIRLDPQNAVAYNNRGTAYLESGESQQSIQSYDQAIRLDPEYAVAYNNRGTAYQELGEHQRSLQDFGQAIRLDPQYPAPYANRAVAHIHLKMNSQAQQDADRALELGFDRSLLENAMKELKD